MSDPLLTPSPKPLETDTPEGLCAADLQLLAVVFDAEFYAANYPDVRWRHQLLSHYLDAGWREGRNPSASFDTRYYLEANADVRASGLCPLLHYVRCGAAEGRLPSPPPQDGLTVKAALAFDANYYYETYKDIPAGSDALQHYLQIGWREGRNPSASFDTTYYLEANFDVRTADVCPLIHYLTRGAEEGRLAVRPQSPAVAHMGPWTEVGDRIQPWLRPIALGRVPAAVLSAAFAEIAADGGKGIVVALSHDDYVEVPGGVENCIGDEARVFDEAGFAYIHLCPAQPLPVLAECSDGDLVVRMRHRGKLLGTIGLREFADALARTKPAARRLYLVIHHLRGFRPEGICASARILMPTEIVVWVHDFFTLCSQHALMRNDVAFCNAPPASSNACRICHYGSERQQHLSRIGQMFSELRPTVLAPSAAALQFWERHGGFERRDAAIMPHGRLSLDVEIRPPRAEYPLHIGYLGSPIYEKGWRVFEELAARHFGDRRYRFFHLGGVPGTPCRNIEFSKVMVNPRDRQAMVKGAMAADLDIVVSWSLCYETFCFTAHEAVAGGAFVIARRDAGNIWPALSGVGLDRAYALDSKEELFEIFASGRVLQFDLTKRYGSLEPGGATADYIFGSRE